MRPSGSFSSAFSSSFSKSKRSSGFILRPSGDNFLENLVVNVRRKREADASSEKSKASTNSIDEIPGSGSSRKIGVTVDEDKTKTGKISTEIDSTGIKESKTGQTVSIKITGFSNKIKDKHEDATIEIAEGISTKNPSSNKMKKVSNETTGNSSTKVDVDGVTTIHNIEEGISSKIPSKRRRQKVSENISPNHQPSGTK